MKHDENSDIAKLIRLKRYEQPPEDFVSGFVHDFHGRQRSELLSGSAHGLFLERVSTYAADFGGSRLLLGAAAACLAGVAVVVVRSDEEQGSETAEAPVEMRLPFRAQPEQPLPLPSEVMDYPTEAYPVDIQKVGAKGDLQLIREF